MNKKLQKVIDNIGLYEVPQLADCIFRGEFTFEEFIAKVDDDPDCGFPEDKKESLKEMVLKVEDNDWAKAVLAHTVAALLDHLNKYPHGKYRDEARNLISQIEEEEAENRKKEDEEKREQEAEDAWQNVDKKSEDSLMNFISEYPWSKRRKEAIQLINKLEIEEIVEHSLLETIVEVLHDESKSVEQQVSEIDSIIRDDQKMQFLELLKNDHNLLPASMVKYLLDQGTLFVKDLYNIEIAGEFIDKIYSGEPNSPITEPGDRIKPIERQSTEIYFWGVPSSGKSCALGAILSAVERGMDGIVMDPDFHSQGNFYRKQLIEIFVKNKVCALPGGTPITALYEMGFDLCENGKKYPINCIDMAGELMCCMTKIMSGQETSQTDEQMIEEMHAVLTNSTKGNRKVHFFVIDYGGENTKHEGFSQLSYLQGACDYIRTYKVFEKDTDAIYILVTKSDKVGESGTKDQIRQYVEEHYQGFYTRLLDICKKFEINNKELPIVPFTLGEVCFQNYCKFDPSAAENVVRIIKRHLACNDTRKRGKLKRKLGH